MSGDAIFRNEGEYWALAYKGPTFRLRDSKGLRYLARLVASPGREFHAMDLVSPGSGAGTSRTPRALSEDALAVGLGDAGEILDPRARAAYRARLKELETEIEEAEAFNDPGRAARAQDEAEALRRELSAAFGLGGRARRAGSAAERARVNVRNSISAALKAIARHDAELSSHLTKAIRTGMYCCYVSDTAWETGAEPEVEPARAEPEHALATFLFTSGARSARAAQHDEILRTEVAAAGGRMLRSPDEGPVALFDAPGDAIRCAVSVLEALDSAGIAARAGVHTGECELFGEHVDGLGVRIGARIGALADPGEILVSSTFRELVAGTDVELVDRGFHELQGVPGTWRLFVLSSTDRRRAPGTHEAGVSLMVVDDHPMWRQTLRTVVEATGLGMVVAEATDGEQAVEMAGSARPEVVIMDMNLPTVNGVEATRRLLDALPETKVLVLSSSDERSDVIEAVKAGATGYLVKTAEPNEVVDAVRRIHAGELVFPPALAKVVLEEFRKMGGASRGAAKEKRARGR